MRLDKKGDLPVVVLSERNVRALYHKLTMEGSYRTLIAPDEAFIVTVEDDALHYANRTPPGEMHPETEEFLTVSLKGRAH
jgi:hypothetical protein